MFKRKAETIGTEAEEVRLLCDLVRSESGTSNDFNRILDIAALHGIYTADVDMYDPLLDKLCEELKTVIEQNGRDESSMTRPT